jgi:regulator of protease activity HflC (stomatin/prohibitin superfamily)
MQTSNDYLNQVVAEQAQVEQRLQRQLHARALRKRVGAPTAPCDADDEEEMDARLGTNHAINYRITGFWRWKTVVVPPNVYVVHTRRGHPEPLHVGLGMSFNYNPFTDAFLVVPAVMQTLLINARCICAERQGILVQAYVQWVVDDIQTAYRKLDFSDPEDPMGIVNIQLREQAEAALKDKVATMSIDDVLNDKQPLIEELTTRLRAVAEGGRESGPGLGLKIVTVQIKEAVVSSTQLWQNLQKPFRAEREKLARMAELEAEQQINRLRHEQDRDQYSREQAERERRLQVEQEAERRAVNERTVTQKAQREAELDLALQQLDVQRRRLAAELEGVRREMELYTVQGERDRQQSRIAAEVEEISHAARCAREERDLALLKLRRAMENDLTPQHVQAQLIARLPEVAASLPRPQELKAISIGGEAAGSLTGFLAGILSLLEQRMQTNPSTNGAAS